MTNKIDVETIRSCVVDVPTVSKKKKRASLPSNRALMEAADGLYHCRMIVI